MYQDLQPKFAQGNALQECRHFWNLPVQNTVMQDQPPYLVTCTY